MGRQGRWQRHSSWKFSGLGGAEGYAGLAGCLGGAAGTRQEPCCRCTDCQLQGAVGYATPFCSCIVGQKQAGPSARWLQGAGAACIRSWGGGADTAAGTSRGHTSLLTAGCYRGEPRVYITAGRHLLLSCAGANGLGGGGWDGSRVGALQLRPASSISRGFRAACCIMMPRPLLAGQGQEQLCRPS